MFERLCGSSVRDLPVDDRPRERLARHGAAALSNRELIAVVLGTGAAGSSALDVADRTAQRGLRSLAGCSLPELARERGQGQAKAARVLAALELGSRLGSET